MFRFPSLILAALLFAPLAHAQLKAERVGQFETGIFDEGAAEIAAYDARTQRLFFVNADADEVVALDLSDPANPTQLFTIDVSADVTSVGGVNSIDVRAYGGETLIAVAVEADPSTDPGTVAFYDALGRFVNQVEVGALPDGLAFAPDGQALVVANEAEEDDGVDPLGSISIITGMQQGTGLSGIVFDVTTLDFTDFNEGGPRNSELADDFYLVTPGVSVAQDIEPEFVTVAPNSQEAYVSLQENNAIAVVDLVTQTITSVFTLGLQDFRTGPGLDASNRDDAINLQNWPLLALRHPDGMAMLNAFGQDYILTANEGDGRGFDELRGADLPLDPDSDFFDGFDTATLQDDANLGRIEVSEAFSDTDGDGDFDRLVAFGTRSFSAFTPDGDLVYDSGDDIERAIATLINEGDLPMEAFNANNDDNDSFDNRSDDGGPEPEGIVTGRVDRTDYIFVGLERVSAVAVFRVQADRTNPVVFETLLINRDFDAVAEAPGQDLGPEGLVFIPAGESPVGQALLVVSNEVSGSIAIWALGQGAPAFTLQLLHASDLEGNVNTIEDAPRFSAVVNALRPEFENSLLISSGDNYIPGPFFAAGSDRTVGAVVGEEGRGFADIALMNAIGFDASAIGNHEFDEGTDRFEDIIEPDSDGYDGTLFPYLSANLDVSPNGDLADLAVPGAEPAQPNSIAPSVILDVNGTQIGVVGATTPLLPIITSPENVIVKPEDPNDFDALAAIVQTEVDALTAAGVDKIIVVSHLQEFNIDQELVSRLSDVDIAIAGGSDRLLADETDILRAGDVAAGPYPTLFQDAEGKDVPVVSTDGQYTYVGRLVIAFDAFGNVLPGSVDAGVSGAFATDDGGVARLGDPAPDAQVVAIVDAVDTVLDAKLSNIFGSTEVFLDGLRGEVRTEETNFGNLTADANLDFARTADPGVQVSFKNGGGIRAPIGEIDSETGERLPPQEIPGLRAEGEIAQLDIEGALSFNNGLSVLELTAQAFVDALENGVSLVEFVSGRFPQVAGVRFSFDPAAAAESRVRTVALVDDDGAVIDVIAQDGVIQGDPTRVVKIVTLDFLAGGGDGYEEFANALSRVDLEDEADLGGLAGFAPTGSEQDALAEFLVANFSETPFAVADTPVAEDTRIQNLGERDEDILTGDGVQGSLASSAAELPDAFALVGAYPNPFSSGTQIAFDLPEHADVSVRVFDMLGREVLAVERHDLAPGFGQTLRVDGRALASGLYVFQVRAELETGSALASGRIVLVK
ncbi:MAG: choice-of-anchor I family protein [Bacteroidota bacterium]